MVLTIILSFCGLTLAALAAIIIYTNYRAATNRWLGAFTISGLLWLLANLFANLSGSTTVNLAFSRLALVGASLLPLTFLMFCIYFTAHKIDKFTKVVIFVPIVGLLLTTPTKLNIISVSEQNLTIKPGISYLFLLIILVVYFSWGITLLLHDYRQSEQGRHQQLYYILLGTGLTVIPGIVLSGLLPLIGYPRAASYGPTVAIFFATFTTIAIIRHRLFDVRLVIARSIGYAGSLVVIASLYGIVVFGTAQFIFGIHFAIGTQIFISAATGIAALTFSRLKVVFDRLTNTLFYQDAYDAQVLFDKLNHVLVSTLNLDNLLKSITILLATDLKAEFCLIGLKEVAGKPIRVVGTQKRDIPIEVIMALRKMTVRYHQSVIATDYLEGEHQELKKILRHHDVAVLVRLTSNVSRTEEGLGYIAFGPKKSGNPYTDQDFRVLDTIANGLVIAVQNALHFEEIQNFNRTLQENVLHATKELRRTNEKLKALDETKDDFISMASHQLRTPLTSVKGYLSLVLEGDAGPVKPAQRQLLNQSFASSQRMVYLISDLLNVSRLRTGKFIIDPSPVNLASTITDEIAQLKEAAESRNVELIYDKPKDFPELMLDDTKIRQVIMNFIDNAIYYTPTGGHIRVELTDKPAAVELRIVDDGIGVPKAEQHHLFTKFYRAGNARKARPDGTGLGLFMAKKVIAAQGGALIFISQEGKGSTFGFSFSKSKLAVPSTGQATAVK